MGQCSHAAHTRHLHVSPPRGFPGMRLLSLLIPAFLPSSSLASSRILPAIRSRRQAIPSLLDIRPSCPESLLLASPHRLRHDHRNPYSQACRTGRQAVPRGRSPTCAPSPSVFASRSPSRSGKRRNRPTQSCLNCHTSKRMVSLSSIPIHRCLLILPASAIDNDHVGDAPNLVS